MTDEVNQSSDVGKTKLPDTLARQVAKRKAQKDKQKAAARKRAQAAQIKRNQKEVAEKAKAVEREEKKKQDHIKKSSEAKVEKNSVKTLKVRRSLSDGFFYILGNESSSVYTVPKDLRGKFSSLDLIQRIADKYGTTIIYEDIQELSPRY